MKKSILFVIDSLSCGGAEKSLVSLLNTFDYENYDVDIRMFSISGMFLQLVPAQCRILPELSFAKFCRLSMVEQLKSSNWRYIYLRVKIFLGIRFERLRNHLHDSQKYWKYSNTAFDVCEKKYDVAIAWGQGMPTHYVATKILADKKIAFINADYESIGYNKRFDYQYYRAYQHIVTVSNQLENLIVNVFPDMVEKISTIYDINNDKLIEKMATLDNPFQMESDVLKIVTVGRLVEAKGYNLVVEACKILRERDLKFKWIVVGEGPERSNIERDITKCGVSDYIILVGAKENPYVYMKNADIYVQTSKHEGYCLTLREARILNIPVVSTNFDAVHNQINDGENGLIVEMNGVAIADAIVRLVTDIRLRNYIFENLKKEKKGNAEEIEKLYSLIEG